MPKRIYVAIPIDTTELCSYGCGHIAKYMNKSKKLMCLTSSNSCPENKRKNSLGVKNNNHRKEVDYKEVYKNLPEETKRKMAWSKGLTKETSPNLARPNFIGKRFGLSLTGHTEESKKKLSKFRTEWLKNPENRKNLGRHKKSWLEITFETYLIDNDIQDWQSEAHFWNCELNKNYYVDFLFESRKLIIELDGTQHRNTKVQDSIRDSWLSIAGYTVIRIPVEEFKKRYFSKEGFLDLLTH